MQHKSQNSAALAMADAMRTECIGVRVGRLHRLVSRTFEQALRPLDLSLPQLEMLSTLTITGEIRPSQLASILAVERSTISRNLAVLSERGLARAVGSTASGRTSTVEITAAGRRKLASARATWVKVQRELHDRLGDAAGSVLDEWLTALQ